MHTYRTTISGLLAGCLPLIMLVGIPSVSVGQFDGLPIYGGGINSQLIYTIDHNSGMADPLHAYIGRIQGLAYDTQNDDFYVGLANSILLRVGNEDGEITMFGNPGRIYHGLAYDPTRNVLWASDQIAQELFTVNPMTAQATLIGNFGESKVGCLAFDPVTDTLYGVDDMSEGSRLVEINKTGASLMQIGPPGLGQNFVDVDSLAFDVETGLLYGIQDNTGDGNTGQMFASINPQTGLATPIGTTGLEYEDGQGLAIPIPEAIASADFDRDGDVDGDDFLSWQIGFGSFPNGGATTADGDADANADVDRDDFLVWQQEFGTGIGSGSIAAAVPEPSTWLLVLIGAAFCCFLRKRS